MRTPDRSIGARRWSVCYVPEKDVNREDAIDFSRGGRVRTPDRTVYQLYNGLVSVQNTLDSSTS